MGPTARQRSKTGSLAIENGTHLVKAGHGRRPRRKAQETRGPVPVSVVSIPATRVCSPVVPSRPHRRPDVMTRAHGREHGRRSERLCGRRD